MNALLYLTTVLIWGTTWIAIKWQLGPVPVAQSIAWRFLLAAAILFALAALRGRLVVPRGPARWLVAGQGVCLFCVNFLCFYHASRWISSGLVAVVFSMATLFNAINARLWFRQPIAPRVMAGGLLGLAGVVALFWQELGSGPWSPASFAGLALALAGTLSFSFGNLLSSRLQRLGYTPLNTNAWAMLCGALLLGAGTLASGTPPVWDPAPRYLWALLYLAVPGSVIGFTAYLTLVGRIGAARAAYATVLFPLVALNVSAWFEGYRWGWAALAGVGLVLCGNLLVFARPARPAAAGTAGLAQGAHD